VLAVMAAEPVTSDTVSVYDSSSGHCSTVGAVTVMVRSFSAGAPVVPAGGPANMISCWYRAMAAGMGSGQGVPPGPVHNILKVGESSTAVDPDSKAGGGGQWCD